jgi:hypothetical protein
VLRVKVDQEKAVKKRKRAKDKVQTKKAALLSDPRIQTSIMTLGILCRLV